MFNKKSRYCKIYMSCLTHIYTWDFPWLFQHSNEINSWWLIVGQTKCHKLHAIWFMNCLPKKLSQTPLSFKSSHIFITWLRSRPISQRSSVIQNDYAGTWTDRGKYLFSNPIMSICTGPKHFANIKTHIIRMTYGKKRPTKQGK